MLNLAKTTERHFQPLAFMAHAIALSSEPFYEVATSAREKKLDTFAAQPNCPEAWYALYRQHRRVEAVLLSMLLVGEAAIEVVDEIRSEANQLRADLWQRVREVRDNALQGCMDAPQKEQKGDFYSQYVEWLEQIIADDQQHEKETALKLLNVLEIRFYLTVTMPCLLEYGTSPVKLLRSARQGNLDAIEKLVRLDSGVLEDPCVRKHLLQAKGDLERTKLLTDAISGSPNRKLTRQNTKYVHAALIWRIGQECERRINGMFDDIVKAVAKHVPKHQRNVFKLKAQAQLKKKRGLPRFKFTMPDIQRLFDAIARDTKGTLRDLDLPVEERTFAKRVRDYVDFWPDLDRLTQK